jgi:hypothetical protein
LHARAFGELVSRIEIDDERSIERELGVLAYILALVLFTIIAVHSHLQERGPLAPCCNRNVYLRHAVVLSRTKCRCLSLAVKIEVRIQKSGQSRAYGVYVPSEWRNLGEVICTGNQGESNCGTRSNAQAIVEVTSTMRRAK